MVIAAEVVNGIRALAADGDDGKACRRRLAGVSVDADEVKAHAGLAHDLLADELGPLLSDLLSEVRRLEVEGVALDADAEGMLALDLALVRVLERVDADEADKARNGRAARSADPALRWELWADRDNPVGVVRFAGVVWSRRVREKWRRGVDRPAAMVRTLVHDRLLPLSRGATLDAATGEVRDDTGQRIAGVQRGVDVATLDLEVMRRGLDVFRSTLARRLIRFFAHEAHRAEVRGDPHANVVLVDGGFSGLCECIGADPGKERVRVRELLAFGRMLDVSTPGLEVGGLWRWENAHAVPGRRAVLEVDLSRRVFLSGAAEAMKATGAPTREAKLARLLVPVLRHDPPYQVRCRAEWGRVWSVADALLVLLVDNGAELAREGGARIDSKSWARLVADAGLDNGRATVVRKVMLEGDRVSPPLLSSVGGERFTLAPEHGNELAFILARSRSGDRKL